MKIAHEKYLAYCKTKSNRNPEEKTETNRHSKQQLFDLKATTVYTQDFFTIITNELESTAFYQVKNSSKDIIITLNTSHPICEIILKEIENKNKSIILLLESLAKYEIETKSTKHNQMFSDFRTDWGIILKNLLNFNDSELNDI